MAKKKSAKAKKKPAKKEKSTIQKDNWSAGPLPSELGKCPTNLLVKCEDCEDFYRVTAGQYVCLNVFVMAANNQGTRMSVPMYPGSKCRFYKKLIGERKIESLDPYCAHNMDLAEKRIERRLERRFAERR